MSALGQERTFVHPIYKMREPANRGGLPLVPLGALRHFAPPLRVRRPLPPYGGTRVSGTKGLLRVQRLRTKIGPLVQK
jgi:hypothetical protein